VKSLEGVQYFESILDTVGNTPLVRLRKVAADLPCPVLAKVETFNPGGSVKDRIGMAMVEAAEREGRLKPGGTIVECTSGNTGLGLAMVAAVKGYRAAFCMPDKVSKREGQPAQGVRCRGVPEPHGRRTRASRQLLQRRQAHLERATRRGAHEPVPQPREPRGALPQHGPELWRQTGGRITHFVAGMGTGGTISGTGRYLKEHNPKVQVIGADPIGSILKHYKETGEMSEAHTYKIEGVGEDFIPTATDFSVVDRILSCNDHDGLNMARTLAREEAIFVGGSAGMAAWVALEVARTCGPDDLVVVLLPDTGERYLTKVHNDEWMRDNHLLDPSIGARRQHRRGQGGALRTLFKVEAGEPLKRALALIQQHDVSQLPVFRGPEVVGTLEEGDVLRTVLADAGCARGSRWTRSWARRCPSWARPIRPTW
jgi:cystathionine beta-synthase